MSAPILRLVHSTPSPMAKHQRISMAFAAAHAVQELDSAFKSVIADGAPCDKANVEGKVRFQRRCALRWLRHHFRDRGVTFTSRGEPIIPGGALRDVDLVKMHRAAIIEALNAFCSMNRTLKLDLDGYEEGLLADAWHAQAVGWSDGGEGTGSIVALVVALDVERSFISLAPHCGPMVEATALQGYNNAVRYALQKQRPAGWTATSVLGPSARRP